MERTRRDALTALAIGGFAVGSIGAGALLVGEERARQRDDRRTVVALAEVLYPSSITGIQAFVETSLDGRVAEANVSGEGRSAAITELNEYALEWYDDRFADLDSANRNALLIEMGVDTADPDPDGSTAERIRYFLVNDLLFAFYASPTGGGLVGIENPQGHPGGLDSYQRGASE